MDMQALQSRYNTLAAVLGLNRMGRGGLAITRQNCPTQQALIDWLEQQAPISGWWCRQSAVVSFNHESGWQQLSEEAGYILNGEAINAAGASLQIRQDGWGGWVATCYTPDHESEGGALLFDEVVQLNNRNAPAPLRYRRYWQLDPERGEMGAFCACFIGFKEENA